MTGAAGILGVKSGLVVEHIDIHARFSQGPTV